MIRGLRFLLSGVVTAALLCVAGGCASRRVFTLRGMTGGRLPLTAVYDSVPDAAAQAVVEAYGAEVDRLMDIVLGHADTALTVDRPESPLSNLVADVLRLSSGEVGPEADLAIVNIGAVRSALPAGEITLRHVFEVLPFDNRYCLMTLTGAQLHRLFAEIWAEKSVALSGAVLTYDRSRRLVTGTVGGRPIAADSLYRVATIDYLAEGNDGMTALLNAQGCDCPEGATLRSLFLKYVEKQTAEGKKVTSALEGRITVKEEK